MVKKVVTRKARSGPTSRSHRASRVHVRRARPGDLDALVELEQRVFATDRMSRNALRRLLTSRSARVLVAGIRGRMAGAAVVLFRAGSSVARLYSIGGAADVRQGSAVALLAAAERAARRRKCRCMRLEVHVRNRAAIARYRKSGYRPFDRCRSYYEDGGDALRFEKPLRARAR